MLSLAWIVFMWVKKDIGGIYSGAELSDAMPMMVTGFLVSLVKVLALAGVVLLAKWLIGKFRGEKK